MKPGSPRLVSLLFLFLLILALLPTPASAQSVVSISPATIVSGVATVITVTGDSFDNTAEIRLDGVALAGTVFVDANTLRVTVPADISLGSHVVTVFQSGGLASGSATLTVTTAAPTVTSVPAPVVRPQIGVQSYRTRPENVQYGQEFVLFVKLRNEGEAQAYNVQATFTSSSLLPLRNGGVSIVGDLIAGNSVDVDQTMTASTYVFGIVGVDMTISYNDAN
ncbi:MAG TPA: IPT/TIG domain-containing protein, partial [Anaerolineales bacterium]